MNGSRVRGTNANAAQASSMSSININYPNGTDNRLLKVALEKGSLSAPFGVPASKAHLPHTFTMDMSGPLYLNPTWNASMSAADPIPYSTDDLRRKVLEKFLRRSSVRRPLSPHNENDVKEAFLDFSVHIPIYLDGQYVGKKAWAKAFYQTEIVDSAKCLFEALFTEEEMRECTLNGKNGTGELSAVKMLAILRASCWMKNKEQDPYFFNSGILEHNRYPSETDQSNIEKKVFTERRSQANRKNKSHKRLRLSNDHDSNSVGSPHYSSACSVASYDGSEASVSIASPGGFPASPIPPVVPVQDQVPHEFGDLEELFYRFPEEFLTRLFPNWFDKYIFIDGLLVNKKDWETAFRAARSNLITAAWTLFECMFSKEEITNCTLNGKNGTTELCPVKKLAILRAVEWMRQKNHPDETPPLEWFHTYWDNDDQECNVFPSKEDKDRIASKVFTEKRYQKSKSIKSSPAVG